MSDYLEGAKVSIQRASSATREVPARTAEILIEILSALSDITAHLETLTNASSRP